MRLKYKIKKFLSVLVIVFLILIVSAGLLFGIYAKISGTYGDMNNDGKLDSKDLIYMLSTLANWKEYESIHQEIKEIRIMSYNILNPEWAGGGAEAKDPAIDLRDELVEAIIKDYAPDVVGLQEVCPDWHSALNEKLVKNGTYKFCNKTLNNGQGNGFYEFNYTILMYNSETVELLEEYTLGLDDENDWRVFSFARFKRKSDDKQFIVVNNHTEASKGDDQDQDFDSIIEKANAAMAKYKDVPFIMIGDYNAFELMNYFPKFVEMKEECNLKNAHLDAEKFGTTYATYFGWGGTPATSHSIINAYGGKYTLDHILVNDDADIKYYSTVIDHSVTDASDHLPIYADIRLN